MNVLVVNNETNLIPTGNGEEANVGGTVVKGSDLLVAETRATHILVGVKGNSVRVTFSDTDPVSAGAGFIYPVGTYVWSQLRFRRARFIESAGSAAVVLRVEGLSE